MPELKVLINNNTLQKRIEQLAQQINSDYDLNEPLNLICVLKGAVMFFAQLAGHLKMPAKMEFVSLSSYGENSFSSGNVKYNDIKLPSFENQNVLIIEDIIDTGLTLNSFVEYIKKNHAPKDVKIAVLFDKKCARKYDIKPDYSAFEVDNKFIVGFGLDYKGLYRNLNYIGYFD